MSVFVVVLLVMMVILFPLLCRYTIRMFRKCANFWEQIRGSPKSHIVEHFSPLVDFKSDKRSRKATAFWSQDAHQSKSRDGKKYKANIDFSPDQSQAKELTPDQFAQMLRPAALATFLSSYSPSSKKPNPPPPEILSHQAIQFSPVLVEALFSNMNQSSNVAPSSSSSNSNPTTSSSSKKQENDITSKPSSSSRSTAGTVKERMVGITVVNEKSKHKQKQKQHQQKPPPLTTTVCRSVNSSANHPDTFPDQSSTPSPVGINGVYSNCFVSPTADSIIISSPPSRKNIYTKNHTLSSTGAIHPKHHSAGHPSHQQVHRMNRAPSSNFETPCSMVCASVHQSETHLNEVGARRGDGTGEWGPKPLSYHESLTVLSNIALTQQERLNSCSDMQARFSTPQNSNFRRSHTERPDYESNDQSSQFCITSV